jgi:aminoglycoside phosphotransferase (APT) family kinase protein
MGRPVPEIAEAALDPSRVRERLRPVAKRLFGPSADIERVAVERYQRRLLRYTIVPAGCDGRRPRRIIAKVYDTAAAAKAGFDLMRQLWDGGFARSMPTDVSMPEPYAHLAHLRLLLMEEVPGESLKRVLKNEVADGEDMRLLAESLAKLHRSERIPGEPFTVEAHLAVRCCDLADPLGEAFSELRDPIRRIVAAAKEVESRTGREAFATAHGDFHMGQVQIAEEKIWILDLDRLYLGDPAYDVAMVFVAFQQLENKVDDPGYVRSLRDAFASAYFARMGWAIAGRLAVNEALIHLKRACKRFRWQDEDGWQDTVRLQIGQALACLEAMRHVAKPSNLRELVELDERCARPVRASGVNLG